MIKDGNINIGDIVTVKRLNKTGEVIAINNNVFDISLGVMTIKLKRAEFEVAKTEEKKTYKKIQRSKTPYKSKVSDKVNSTATIDLHQLRVKEAVENVEKFIDNALYKDIHILYIIHGKGTGKLLNAVQDLLNGYKKRGLISGFQFATPHDGGYGKTIVFMR